MIGKSWGDVSYNGKTYDLKHLHPFSFQAKINGADVAVSVAFSNHCFTDKKGEGSPLMGNRYFCEARYQCSLELPSMIQKRLIDGHIVPHFDKNSNEVYYYAELYDYAVFFDLRPDVNNPGGLTLFVTSAYELDQWGKGTVPRGNAVKFTYIGHLRLSGNTYLPTKKQRRR
ncbi:hypothetical protein [Serratia silvae]|uniref:Uncharacterized protein n=1 Tax=Serratia silvae TaxID=2824122 RepID=A0ABT0KH51_9GAMM|nr:hypothetical protein [Serratia silvae]MCL1031344.1 hypothetical protein [Serratia silvae]